MLYLCSGFTITLVLIFVNIGHLYILVSVMSYIKVAVTLLKYIPQVLIGVSYILLNPRHIRIMCENQQSVGQ